MPLEEVWDCITLNAFEQIPTSNSDAVLQLNLNSLTCLWRGAEEYYQKGTFWLSDYGHKYNFHNLKHWSILVIHVKNATIWIMTYILENIVQIV